MHNSPCTSLLLWCRSFSCSNTFSSHIHRPSLHQPDGGEKNWFPSAHTCMSTICQAILHSPWEFLPGKAIARISPHLRPIWASGRGKRGVRGSTRDREGRSRQELSLETQELFGRTVLTGTSCSSSVPAHAKPDRSSGFHGVAGNHLELPHGEVLINSKLYAPELKHHLYSSSQPFLLLPARGAAVPALTALPAGLGCLQLPIFSSCSLVQHPTGTLPSPGPASDSF